MIIVAVAIGLAVYAYANNFVAQSTRSTEAPRASLSLDAADCPATDQADNIVAWVRNTGGFQARISHAYITYPNGTVVQYAFATPITIDPQEVQQVSIPEPASKPFVEGYVYSVKLVCMDGTTLTFSVRAHAA